MTQHVLYHADARDLSFVKDNSVHLILTSPPYFNLKEYRKGRNQLGIINDYQQFIDELEKYGESAIESLYRADELYALWAMFAFPEEHMGDTL